MNNERKEGFYLLSHWSVQMQLIGVARYSVSGEKTNTDVSLQLNKTQQDMSHIKPPGSLL